MSQNLPPKKTRSPETETIQRIVVAMTVILASPFLMIAMALIVPPAGCAMLMSRTSFPKSKNAFMVAMIVFMIPWAFFIGYVVSQIL